MGPLLAILKKQFCLFCLFHPVNNGCIVRKKIIVSSLYCVIVEAAKKHFLLQLNSAVIDTVKMITSIYSNFQSRKISLGSAGKEGTVSQ